MSRLPIREAGFLFRFTWQAHAAESESLLANREAPRSESVRIFIDAADGLAMRKRGDLAVRISWRKVPQASMVAVRATMELA